VQKLADGRMMMSSTSEATIFPERCSDDHADCDVDDVAPHGNTL